MVERRTFSQDTIKRFVDKVSRIKGIVRIVMTKDRGSQPDFLLIADDERPGAILDVSEGWTDFVNGEGRALLIGADDGFILDETGYQDVLKDKGGEDAPGREVNVLWERPKETSMPVQA